jgi:integrase
VRARGQVRIKASASGAAQQVVLEKSHSFSPVNTSSGLTVLEGIQAKGIGAVLHQGELHGAEILRDFEGFCRIDRQLGDRTARGHVWQMGRLLDALRKDPRTITRDDLRSYLAGFEGKAPATYANALKSLKVFFRDYLGRAEVVQTFRFPRKEFKPKMVPSRADLQKFYMELDSVRDRALFLLYATSGLRKNEVLSLCREDIDFEKRMIIPRKRGTRTKRTWVSFFNEEAKEALMKYLETRTDDDPRLSPLSSRNCKIFRNARAETGLQITPQVLREFFACELGRLNVPDRYVDAFCGRVPQSVLARHFKDFSPRRLKEICDQAKMRVVSGI